MKGTGVRRSRRGTVVTAVVITALTVMLATVAAGLSRAQDQPFPHEEHTGLFPVCTGCHAESGIGADPGFPERALCARCHDGASLPEVAWTGPSETASNVTFDHASHAAALEASAEPAQSCESCHSDPAGPRMQVDDRVREDGCFACHASGAADHYTAPSGASAECATCHMPLAGTSFPVTRIAGLPVPDDHLDGAFLGAGHGAEASAGTGRCATCHTQDRCLTCHVDTDNAVVHAVPAAPAEMELPPATAAYPVPASHRAERFAERHAPPSGPTDCVTCHTTDDCRACHVGAGASAVDALPRRADVRAPGVGLRPSAPGTHTSPFFVEAHATLAAADAATCATCHTEAYCTDCHDGPAGTSYHPEGFVGGHAAVAFGRSDECASCHETAVFCRSCHIDSGLGSDGRLGAGYHDAEPIWLLRHGQAARQNLESCASCHQQRDCVQCHGVLGSFKVSPHRPGFDAAEAWARSPRTCLACHVGNPLPGGSE